MNKIIQVKDRLFVEYIAFEAIQNRLREICAELKPRYAHTRPIFIGILNGSFMLAADVMRYIDFDCEITFVKFKSYRGMESTGEVSEMVGLELDVTRRDVIILEDIVDTGRTLSRFMADMKQLNPASVALLTVLHKPDALLVPVKIDYCGFNIPNKFVVGYGLDYDGHGRNLRDIYQLKID
jgi:hypoxanthine phosphoribosyltransferase